MSERVSSTLGSSLTVEDLGEIAEQVWSSYVDPDERAPLFVIGAPDQDGEAPPEVSASVSITGAVRGRVVVGCSANLARWATAALLALDKDAVTVPDIVDALGELTNIIGGNVKSVLPAACGMTLPRVALGMHAQSDVDGPAPAGVRVCEVVADWLGERLSISVWQD